MSPPASDAVQGGYLVAIFATGVAFGGIALVFKEITEGLCCLLGGFCIGMWLITLKAGGLVTGDGTKVGFILAFTVGFYCLSFSHYTRSYGSIVCTAFGGSTAFVLGIDCYSRAGLKEFWLYIWGKLRSIPGSETRLMILGLNDDAFPLNTYTYPVTRNIRVESAIIMIVAIFGVIFQLRLWKVIKERRAKEEGLRQEAERSKEESEAEIGRQLEAKNLKERAEWEHVYGNGSDGKEPSMTETAVADDSRRGSENYGSSVHEKGTSIEMKEMGSPDPSARVSDSGNNLEVVEEVVAEGSGEHSDAQAVHNQDQHESHVEGVAGPMEPPAAVPRNLRIETNIVADNDSEHGAVLGSEVGTPRSKRFSGRSLMNRMSWRSGHGPSPNPLAQTVSEEALIVSHDASSSVYGIADDLHSVTSERTNIEPETRENVAVVSTHVPSNKAAPDVTETEQAADETKSQNNGSETATIIHTKAPEPAIEQLQRKVTGGSQTATAADEVPTANAKDAKEIIDKEVAVEDSQPEVKVETVTPAVEELVPEPQPQANAELPENEKAESEHAATESKSIAAPSEKVVQESVAASEPEQKAPSEKPKPVEKPKLNHSTVKEIPEQTSRIVNSFRTREWAKHLADADVPEYEPFPVENELPDSPVPEETAAPVDVAGLLQTPLNAQPPPAVPTSIPISREQSYRESRDFYGSPDLPRSKTRQSSRNVSTPTSPPISRNVSSASFSSPDLNNMAGMRNSSAPHLTVTVPNEPEQDSSRWSGPPPLMAVRENMMRNRMSSTSLRYDPWTASRSQSRQSVGDPTRVLSPAMSIPEERDEIEEVAQEDHDDIPLSKRRTMLQRQNMESPSSASIHSAEQARSPTYPAVISPVSPVSPVSPPSADPGRSAAVMAAWRQSVRDDLSKSRDNLTFKSPPLGTTTPDRSRNTWSSVQQMRDASNTQLGNTIADEMQRGNMTDLHRQAMRRMQASANRQL